MASCQPASKFSGKEVLSPGCKIESDRAGHRVSSSGPCMCTGAHTYTYTCAYHTQQKYHIKLKTIKLDFQTIGEPQIRTLCSKRSSLFQNPEERRVLTLTQGAGFDTGPGRPLEAGSPWAI